MLGEVFCHLRGHRVDRHKVWHDGIDFRVTCPRCGQPLVREYGVWRPFDTDRDLDVRRKPHPHFDRPAA